MFVYANKNDRKKIIKLSKPSIQYLKFVEKNTHKWASQKRNK